jgi:hypothetical protein
MGVDSGNDEGLVFFNTVILPVIVQKGERMNGVGSAAFK